jgi:branched-chain amino acid transport system ATP-binding protein
MLQRLKQLKSAGQTVLISEQNLRFANELADRVYIIEKGQIPYQGTPAELNSQPEVRQQYLMV